MFTIYHFIWLAICIALIAASILLINKFKPKFSIIETVAVIICILSEAVKVFSLMTIVQGSDGQYHPYLQLNQLPFHLCSIQIILICICKFSSNEKLKRTLRAFMFPTCMIGAAFALALPSIFSTTISVTQAFTHPIAYQTFLYHTMLIVYGYCILKYNIDDFKSSDYIKSLGILAIFWFCSLYINSIFATAVYDGTTLVSVEFTPNFFFSYETPIGLDLSEMWQWYIYSLILIALAFSTIALIYIPVFIKCHKKKLSQPREEAEIK